MHVMRLKVINGMKKQMKVWNNQNMRENTNYTLPMEKF